MRRGITIVLIGASALAVAGCGSSDAPKSTAVAEAGPASSPDFVNGAILTGKVTFEGAAPAPKPIDMSANPACERTHKDHPVVAEDVVVNQNGTLGNVFVWIKAGLKDRRWVVPATPVTLDQRECMYHPRVLGVMTGQPIQITNSDPTNHNLHAVPELNPEWNDTQSPGEAPKMRTFAVQEVMIPVKCNVHPWMRSYIGVVSHPFFAVTGDDGTFHDKRTASGDIYDRSLARKVRQSRAAGNRRREGEQDRLVRIPTAIKPESCVHRHRAAKSDEIA